MKKRIIVLAFCVLICLSSIFAEEIPVEKKNHISLSTGVFISEIEYGRDIGRWEVGVGIETGFPNLFIIGTISNPSNALQNLKESFTTLAAVEVFGTYDVIPSPRHDLDLGLGVEGLYLKLFGNNVMGIFLNGKIRYAYNIEDSGRILLELNIPTVAYTFNLEGGEGDFGYFYGEGMLAMAGLFGTKIGCAFTF